MALFKRGRTWWMSFTYQGQQTQKSTGVKDRKLAEKIYCKIMTQIAEGKWFERLPGDEKTFKEMMDRYMTEHSIPNKKSWQRDRDSLTHIFPVFGELTLPEITSPRISEYKSHRRLEGAAPATINKELALMKHAFTLAIKEWEWARENPVKNVRMEKEPPPRDRWLTYEEEGRLLSVCPAWLKEIIIFAIETGARRGEILSLTWNEVNLPGRLATILGQKTAVNRSIPLTQRVFEILKTRGRSRSKVRSIYEDLVFTYPEGKRVDISDLRLAFQGALRKAGIQGFRFHDLRHSFASRWAQAGIDTYTIQTLMGHKSFSTTQRYAHHNSQSLRRGMRLFEAVRDENAGKDFITILAQ